MTKTYIAKNADYGDSFSESYKEWDYVAGMVRISDKYNRIKTLLKTDKRHVKDETKEDTLLDLACYSIMLLMELQDSKEAEK